MCHVRVIGAGLDRLDRVEPRPPLSPTMAKRRIRRFGSPCEAGEPISWRLVGLAFMVMSGKRVFVSGVGGELGTTIAGLLESESWVGDLSGIDADPPRHRLHRTVFHRIHPDEHDRIVDTVARFNPHVLVHVGVWEPDARAAPSAAATLTDQAATSILGAAAECAALEHVVVRSGIEIYGRGRGALTRPNESAPIAPTSDWGAPLQRSNRPRRRSVNGWVSPWERFVSPRCSAPTCRHRSGGCCVNQACRSACSPIRRSR